MPIFINEVVFRGDLRNGSKMEAAAADPAMREALIAEVTQAVIDYLERERDRVGER